MNALKQKIDIEATLFEGEFMVKHGSSEMLNTKEVVLLYKKFNKGLSERLKSLNEELNILELEYFNYHLKLIRWKKGV